MSSCSSMSSFQINRDYLGCFVVENFIRTNVDFNSIAFSVVIVGVVVGSSCFSVVGAVAGGSSFAVIGVVVGSSSFAVVGVVVGGSSFAVVVGVVAGVDVGGRFYLAVFSNVVEFIGENVVVGSVGSSSSSFSCVVYFAVYWFVLLT